MRHNLGRVVATAAVAAAVPHHQITALLDRHAAGDWGDLSEDDRAANDEAARTGAGRLFSSYATCPASTPVAVSRQPSWPVRAPRLSPATTWGRRHET
ncbi:MAG: hypothetical protein ACK55X_07625 [Synechococcaceae cyanobacterium]